MKNNTDDNNNDDDNNYYYYYYYCDPATVSFHFLNSFGEERCIFFYRTLLLGNVTKVMGTQKRDDV